MKNLVFSHFIFHFHFYFNLFFIFLFLELRIRVKVTRLCCHTLVTSDDMVTGYKTHGRMISRLQKVDLVFSCFLIFIFIFPFLEL